MGTIPWEIIDKDSMLVSTPIQIPLNLSKIKGTKLERKCEGTAQTKIILLSGKL